MVSAQQDRVREEHIYIVGGNPEAAKVSGINVGKVIIAVFIIESMFIGAGRYPGSGQDRRRQLGPMEMHMGDAISSCVVGGVSLSGGVGKVSGVIIGVLIFTFISYGLAYIGVNSNWQLIVKGLIIWSAVALDMRKNS